MDVHRYQDTAEFLRHAGQFLAAREAEHNLILGLSSRLKQDPLAFGEAPYLAVVKEGEQVVAAALRTPPHNLVLSQIDDHAALEPLCADVLLAFGSLPGVTGPTEEAARFVELWQAATGARGRRAIAERIFRAESVERARAAWPGECGPTPSPTASSR